MNLGEILQQDAVLPELAAETKADALAELAAPLLAPYPELRAVDVISILSQRESLGSTAVGEGIAIPHGKIPGLLKMLLAVGRSRAGIDFSAPDHQLCHIFFLILMPEQGAGQHLRLLAQIARRAKDPVFRHEVNMAETAGQIRQALVDP